MMKNRLASHLVSNNLQWNTAFEEIELSHSLDTAFGNVCSSIYDECTKISFA